jgi:EmrB/QacA subfamily drug resistance transporter
MLALLPAALDQTAVSTALPGIAADMERVSYYPLVMTSYLVSSCTLAPIAGKLGDRGWRKAMLLIGLAGFVAASALCALSGSMLQLIASRALQGVFAGVLFGGVFRIIPDFSGPELRGRMQSLFAAATGVAIILGPLAGGLLTDNLGWRWVFYINIPIGTIAAVAVACSIPTIPTRASWQVTDLRGAAALVALLTPLMIALSSFGLQPFNAQLVAAMLGLAALMLVVFLVTEARSESPILPLAYFRSRTFQAVIAVAFFSAFGSFATLLFGPLLMQDMLGLSATVSGASMIPMGLGAVTAWVITAALIQRFGPSRLLGAIGVGLILAGVWNLSKVTPTTDHLRVMVSVLVVGLGLGATIPLTANFTRVARPDRIDGFTADQVQFFRILGGAFAAGLLGTILVQGLGRELPAVLPAAAPGGALHYTFLAATVIVVIALIVTVVAWPRPSATRPDVQVAVVSGRPGAEPQGDVAWAKYPAGLRALADEIRKEYESELGIQDQQISHLVERVQAATDHNRDLETRITLLTDKLAESMAGLVRASEKTLSLARPPPSDAGGSPGLGESASEES